MLLQQCACGQFGAVIVALKEIRKLFNVILCRKEHIQQALLFALKLPFGQPLIIKLLVEIADEKRQDLLFKALLEQKQLSDSAVPVIEWMDPLQLKEAVDKDPKLRAKFTDEQLEPIANGDTPDGCTWHLTLKLERCNL